MSHHRTAARTAAAATAEVRSPRLGGRSASPTEEEEAAAVGAAAAAGPTPKLDSAAALLLPSSHTAHMHGAGGGTSITSPTVLSRAMSEASSATQRSSAISSQRRSDWSSSGFDLTALSELTVASVSGASGPSSGVATAAASSATSPTTGAVTLGSRHQSSGGVTPGSPLSGPCSPQLGGVGTEVARLRRKLTRSRASLEDYAARNLALENENALLKLQLAEALRLARGSMAGGGAWDPDAQAHDPQPPAIPSQSPSQQCSPTVMGAVTFDLQKVSLLGLSAEASQMYGHPDVVVATGVSAASSAARQNATTSPTAVSETGSATVSPASSNSSRLRSPSEAVQSPSGGHHPPQPPQRHFSMPHAAHPLLHSSVTGSTGGSQQQHYAQGSGHAYGHSSRASYPSAASSSLLHSNQSPQLPLHHPAHAHGSHLGHAAQPFSLGGHTQSSYSSSSASSGLASPAASPLGGPSGGGQAHSYALYPHASPPLQPYQPASPGFGSMSRSKDAGVAGVTTASTQSPRASIHRHALLSIDTEAHRRASQVSSISSSAGSAVTASLVSAATPSSARTADQPLSPFVLSPASASSTASAGVVTHPLRPGGRSAMAASLQSSPASAPHVEPFTPSSPASAAPPLEASSRNQMVDMAERERGDRDRAAHLSPLRQIHTQQSAHGYPHLHHLQLGPAAHFSNVSAVAAPFSMASYLHAQVGAIHANEGADPLANVTTALHSASASSPALVANRQQPARSPPLSGLGDASAGMQPMPPMSPSFEAASSIGSPGGRSARVFRASHASNLSAQSQGGGGGGGGVNESNAGRRLTSMQDIQAAMPPLLLSLAGGSRTVRTTSVAAADDDDFPSSPPTLPPTPSTSVSSSSHSRSQSRESSSSNSNSGGASLSASAVNLRSMGAGGEPASSVHSPSAPTTSPPVGPVGRSRANSRGGNGLRFGQEEVFSFDSPAPTTSMHGHSASMGVSLSHAPHVASPMLRALSMGSAPGSSFAPASPLLSPLLPQHGAMRGSHPEVFVSQAVAEQLLGKHSKRSSDGSAAAADSHTPPAHLGALNAATPSASTSPSSGRSLTQTPAALSSTGPSPSLPEESDESDAAAVAAAEDVSLASPRTILSAAAAASVAATASAASSSASSPSSASVVPLLASPPVISSPRLVARKTSMQSARLAGRKRSGSTAELGATGSGPAAAAAGVDPGIALQALQIEGLEEHQRLAPKAPTSSMQGSIISGTTR